MHVPRRVRVNAGTSAPEKKTSRERGDGWRDRGRKSVRIQCNPASSRKDYMEEKVSGYEWAPARAAEPRVQYQACEERRTRVLSVQCTV